MGRTLNGWKVMGKGKKAQRINWNEFLPFKVHIMIAAWGKEKRDRINWNEFLPFKVQGDMKIGSLLIVF
jgi:hypothetical protein